MSGLREKIEKLRAKTAAETLAIKAPKKEPGVQQPKAKAELGAAPAAGTFRPFLTKTAPVTVTYKVQRQAISIPFDHYQELVQLVQNKLYDEIDPTVMSQLSKADAEQHIRKLGGTLLEQLNVNFSRKEKDQFVQDLIDEITGYGPLQPLLDDPNVSDALTNGARQTYVEVQGKLHLTDVVFRDDRHLMNVIDRIVMSVGRHIDEGSPMCDARLPDGSRVNAIIPPLALDGPALSIRKFKADLLTPDELIHTFGSMTEEIGIVLEACVKARLNILISGGTGAGKTTLLNVMSGFIPHDQRVVTIEDSAELQLQQPHVVRLETRPPNIEGRGEIGTYELLKNSLRMRPDRIIVGEVRGREVLDMLQAMNTGHDGSMCTIHANAPRDALSRMETMILMSGIDLPQRAMRQQVSSAIDLVLQLSRLSDGSRKVTYFSEVLGMEGDIVTMQDIFVYDRRGMDEEGRVLGAHVATGVQPRFMQRLRACGIELPPGLFVAPE
jgi:pilus assembly protein CpaF